MNSAPSPPSLLARSTPFQDAGVASIRPSGQGDITRDWRAFRQAFPTTSRFVYLDTARKALVPQWIEQAFGSWLHDIYDEAGGSAFSMGSVEEARADIAGMVGAPADCLALVKNTSEGMNIIAQGLGLEAGDNVVLSEFEHENNTFPWRYLTRRGIDVRIVAGGPDGRIALDRYREVIDGRTRVVTAAWVTYGNGFRSDVPAIADIAHRHGAIMVVDGIQAMGILNARIDAISADAVICGGHKTLLALAGAGLLYMRKELIERVTPPYAAKFSFTSIDRAVPDLELMNDAHRFEYGNPNFLGIWVQRLSARTIQAVGLDRIEARVHDLTDRLLAGLDERGVAVRTPRPWHERAGIVSMDVAEDAVAVVKRLAERKIIVSEKDGFVRASIHAYNDENDIDAFLDAIGT